MQVYVSNREIEQIAEGLVHVACGKPPPKRIDIDAVAAYLGLTVRYEKFAESDPDKICLLYTSCPECGDIFDDSDRK